MALDSFIKKLEDDSFYYSDYEFVTNSQLGLIKKDVRTYKMMRDHPELRVETFPMIFGRAYHVAMLEPNEFNDKVKVFNSATRTTKGYKEFKENNSDAPTIILQKEYDRIMRMQDVLFSHSEVRDLLQSQGEREIANAWQDDDTGVFCKGKADYRNGNVLVDLKTTGDGSFYGFSNSCKKYGYDRQSAFYMDGFNCDEFVFITQEKERPYNVSIFYAGDDFLNRGRDEYKYLLDTYRRFFIDNEEVVEEHLVTAVL
jgi:exodeoxyribonuclease VIII